MFKKGSKFNTSDKEDVIKINKNIKEIYTSKDSPNLKLLIDSRETDTDLLNSLINDKANEFFVQTKQLEVGDFVITLDDKICYVIERKRLDDLCSSIKDGRLAKQTQNMETMCKLGMANELNRNVFIFEKLKDTVPFGNNQSLPRATMITAMINRLTKGISTLMSENSVFTSLIVLQLYLSILREIDAWRTKINECNTLSEVTKQIKNELFQTNQEQEDWMKTRQKPEVHVGLVNFKINEKFFINQLLIINRMGFDFALEIQKKYHSTLEFCQCLQKSKDDNTLKDLEKTLSCVVHPKSNRKLGPKLAHLIIESFSNESVM